MDIPEQVLRHFDAMMERVAWEPTPPPPTTDMPYETHRGIVRLPDPLPDLVVVQLNDGRRLITQDSMHALLRALGIEAP
jgi:hypothetical protein